MAALSSENLVSNQFVEPLAPTSTEPFNVRRYMGKSARQQAMNVVEAFGVPALAYLGVNKDTIDRVSMRKEAHWKCPHQKYMSVNVDFSESRKRRAVSIDIDDKWEDDAWVMIVDLILDGEIPISCKSTDIYPR